MRRVILLAALLLPGIAWSQSDCDQKKKAFEEARKEYEETKRRTEEAHKYSTAKSQEYSKQQDLAAKRQGSLRELRREEGLLTKAHDDAAKWLSKGDLSLAKQSETEAEYWAKEITKFKQAHPEVDISDADMEGRLKDARAESSSAFSAWLTAIEKYQKAKESYDRASREYQACMPDDHTKVPPGTCETLKKESERQETEFHRKNWKGVDKDTFDRADRDRLEAHKRYCQCLWDNDVRPLPSECAYYEPRESRSYLSDYPYLYSPSGAAPKTKLRETPPKSKSIVPVPPPPISNVPGGAPAKTTTAPPPVKTPPPPTSTSTAPPPPATPPPPPPKAPPPPPSTTPPPNTSAPPPASPVLISSCNTTPCPCKTQTPQKKCTAVACTGCQK